MIKNILLSTAALGLLVAPISEVQARDSGDQQQMHKGTKARAGSNKGKGGTHRDRRAPDSAMQAGTAAEEGAMVSPPEGAAQKSLLGRVKSGITGGIGGFLSNE